MGKLSLIADDFISTSTMGSMKKQQRFTNGDLISSASHGVTLKQNKWVLNQTTISRKCFRSYYLSSSNKDYRVG